MTIAVEDVTGGEVKVNLAIDKIPFISTEFDLCDIASDAKLSCPIKAGQHTLFVSQSIPDEAPSVSEHIFLLAMFVVHAEVNC